MTTLARRHALNARAVLAGLAAGLALGLAVPAAAHDLWLVPGSFAPAAGEAIGVGLWLDEAGVAEPIARHEALIERFDAVGPAEGVVLPVVGLPGRHPAGVLRPPVAGAWTVVYLGRPTEMRVGAEEFEAYLAEEGLRAAQRLRREHGTTGEPTRERFARSLKALLAVGGGPPDDRLLGLPLELVLEDDAGGVCRIAVAAAGTPVPGVQVDVRPLAGDGAAASAFAGDDGRVALPCAAAGGWLATAVTVAPDPQPGGAPGDPPSAWSSVWASLTFARAGGAESR